MMQVRCGMLTCGIGQETVQPPVLMQQCLGCWQPKRSLGSDPESALGWHGDI